MSAKTKKRFKIIIIIAAVMIMIWIWDVNRIVFYEPRKEPIDTSAMGGEAPVKMIRLNPNNAEIEFNEAAYLLGDKGNVYILRHDTEKYYVELWHPEFWKGIKVVDICAARPYSCAAALDSEGNIYVWESEYACILGKEEPEIYKREDWKIQQVENVPKTDRIYAVYHQFIIVTEKNNIYRWYSTDNIAPDMEDLEMIDMETPIVSIAATKEELFILDRNHVLWTIKDGAKSVLTENIKSIMQGGKGLAIQMMDNEKEVYIYNIDMLKKDMETVTFADKYEAAKVVFADNISSMSVSGSAAVVCTEKQEFYRWGTKRMKTRYGIYVPSIFVCKEPVKIDLENVKYYTVIREYVLYVNEQNETYILLLNG